MVSEISHAEAQALVSKAWGGELSPSEAEQFVAHMAECEPCREAAERLAMFLARFDRAIEGREEPREDTD